MARKNRTSPLEDMLSVVALMPWWVGVAIAVVGYLVLPRFATPPQVTAVQPGQITGLMAQTMITGLAYAGQFIVPFVGLVGAVMSFVQRRQRSALVTDVVQAKGADALDGMSWREFEILVGEAFRLQGYGVTEIGGGGADGGVDLVLKKGNEKFLVQCKQWKAFKVGVDVVRELYGVMAAKGATGGFVVTSGTFTSDATAFASGRNVKLIDGQRLFGLLNQARQSVSARSTNGRSLSDAPGLAGAVLPCPICAADMVKRTAQKGASAGCQFWGCSKYPACRGTRAIG